MQALLLRAQNWTAHANGDIDRGWRSVLNVSCGCGDSVGFNVMG
jgi:hypothetical protein